MNKLQKVDKIFRSSFDELIESIFQKPLAHGFEEAVLPLSNIGDYIDLYKDKKALEGRIQNLKEQLATLTQDLHIIESKESALKRSEQSLLEEKDSLKTASDNKSLFLANMSHEIRTPMNGVFGSLEILKETELTDDQQKYLGIIETCAHTLLSVVDDVLDYSKIEANELKIETVEFNLKEIVSQVRDILIFKAQEKGIEFTTHIVHNVPIWLKGDPLRIRQILLNLASNAVKFTNAGLVAIEISLEAQDSNSVRLKFTIKDTGIGIKEEQKAHLFQSYSQINTEITRKFGGTGLGLAISKKLTDLMKGTIGVKSEEGFGSEFWFSIPLEKQIGTKKHKSDLFQLTKKHHKQSRTTIRDISLLLVEDDEINQKITSILLEKEGFNVTIVENGKKALQALNVRKFDVILMDVEMPGLNGYETTRKIRQLKSNHIDSNIPIIAMTAHAMTGDREKCLSAGMNDYIPKPINMHLLNDIIERFLLKKPEKASHFISPAIKTESEIVIQADKLRHLQSEVEERFEQLVNVFLESIPLKVSAIFQAIEQMNFSDLRMIAHQLKGSCASFYAQQMAKICQELELMAMNQEKNQRSLLQQARDLELEAKKVINYLKEHFQ